VEYEGELYAERLRLKQQAAALAAGNAEWTEHLSDVVRKKLCAAWEDARSDFEPGHNEMLVEPIAKRTRRSLGRALKPGNMTPPRNDAEFLQQALDGAAPDNDDLLSLIEAEHEVLNQYTPDKPTASALAMFGPNARVVSGSGGSYDHSETVRREQSAETFRKRVNEIFEAHLVGFGLHQDSRLIPVKSHEMHNAVVAPTLYLLHSQPRFAAAEQAYQDALREIRNRDAGDAITDAGTALQGALKAPGCDGNALGDQLKSAKKKGLVRGTDTPLTDAVIQWVAAQRNAGEAHTAGHDFTMSDAWMIVHVVGALIIRLAEASQ
jgi:hypothetical protein